jgi:MBG domain/Bacterial Ig-like domain (group 3)/RTX calcium-binding nonapeptide repeat (4 copies)
VTLTAATPVGGTFITSAVWTLSNVVVTKYQTADGEEEYDLVFTGAEFSFTPTDSLGKQGPPVDASFSFKSDARVTLGDLVQQFDGQPLFATATTNPPDLDVELSYSQNGQPVVSPTAAGSYQVVATIVDANFQGIAVGTLVITPAATAISLSSSVNPSVPGQYVSLTSSISVLAPGMGALAGTVTFWDGSTLLATVPLAGNQATYSTSIDMLGNHTIAASFAPTGLNYTPPRSAASIVQHILPVALESDASTSRSALYVGSTLYNDVITISVKTAIRGNDTYAVEIDTQEGRHGSTLFTSKGTAPGTISKVVAFGVGTSDLINVSSGSSVVSEIFGGPGINVLHGGDGNNLLVGGPGANVLVGGPGRNILIGGKGIGVLSAGRGDTILIAGSTTFDTPTSANLAALDQIMAEWGSSATVATREAQLSGAAAGGLNGTNFLNSSTVNDDALGDVVVAGSGSDWLFADVASDIVVNKKSDKVTNIRGW